MYQFQRKKTNTHAICHSRHRNQSPHLNTLNFKTYKSNSVQSQINPTNSIYKALSTFTKNSTIRHNPNQFINVFTRNRLQIETSNRTIVRRYRRPNKKNTNLQTIENQPKRPPLVTISTQTEDNDNIGIGREPLQPELHSQILTLSSNRERMPNYRKQLARVFGEEFLAKATRQDRKLTPIIKMIKDKDWESLKKSNKYIYALRKDLAITESVCMLCDNKLVIPRNLKQFVIDAIHQTRPGQAGMLSLGNLIWFPCIHRSLTSKALACEDYTK